MSDQYGIQAIKPVDATHVLGFVTARASTDDALLEIWNGPTSADLVFTIDEAGQLQGADGTVSRPTYSFENAKDAGFYYDPSSGDVEVAADGVQMQSWGSASTLIGDANTYTTGTDPHFFRVGWNVGAGVSVRVGRSASTTSRVTLDWGAALAFSSAATINMVLLDTRVIDTSSAVGNLVSGYNSTFGVGATNDQNWTASPISFAAFRAVPTVHASATGTITGTAGLLVEDVGGGAATITNQYGLYVEALTAGSNNYVLYAAGAGDIVLTSGNMDIVAGTLDVGGATTLDGTLAVNGAAITSDDATFALLNTTPTTINFGGAAAINMSGSGLTTTVSGDLTVSEGATITAGGLTVTAGSFVVSDTGPHAIGAATQDYAQFLLDGSFTSLGAADHAAALKIASNITGAALDTDSLALILTGSVYGGSITTQGNTDTIGRVATAIFDEPGITVGAGDTVTLAATLLVRSAPTEGATNAALYVASGESFFNLIDLTQVAAGSPVIRATATTDTPTSSPETDAETGWLEIEVGGAARYIPFYT